MAGLNKGANSTTSQPRMSLLAMTVVMLLSLVSGIAMTIPGIAFIEDVWTSGIGIFLIVGVLLFVCSIGIRTSISDVDQTEATNGLSLYVLIEFLAGVALIFIGVFPTFVDPTQRGLGFAGILLFGLVLAADSILFYRRVFKRTRIH